MSNIYKREYKFDDDDSILDSFQKIYEEHDIEYQPREKTQFIRVRYLLQKMKNVCFPIFPMGRNGEKSIWKEREMNTFPFLSIYFFSHFSPWGKMGKHAFFHGQKWGWTPPPKNYIITNHQLIKI